MAKTVPQNQELTVCFLEKGLELDKVPTKSSNFYSNDRFYTYFNIDPYRTLLLFGFEKPNEAMTPSLAFVHSITRRFITVLSKNVDIEITRRVPLLPENEAEEICRDIPFALGSEWVDAGWVISLWNRLGMAFESEIPGFKTVTDFLRRYNPEVKIFGRVYFHLVENNSEGFPFTFLATYIANPEAGKRTSLIPLRNALLEYKEETDQLLKLLVNVTSAAVKSRFIRYLVESGELFSSRRFTVVEAYIFLKEIPLYEESGIVCHIPDWWKKKSNSPRLSVSIGDKAPVQLGMDALLSFDTDLYLGDERITKEEIEALLSQTAGLGLIKGKWTEVNHDKLKALLTAYDKIKKTKNMTFRELVQMQLGLRGVQGTSGKGEPEIVVSHGEWLSGIRKRLLHPGELKPLTLGDNFRTILRHYQEAGLGWLYAMKSLGFGALLADDMGLGKTVEILALLEYMRQNRRFKALLVIPASLIGNWEKEILRFTPELRYRIMHSRQRNVNIPGADLFITTYGMASRLPELRDHTWDMVILDEAQAIKNPASRQTKSVKQLKSSFRIAMTGTPIENRLSDLWSLFDFLNPGLLGSAREFTAFAKGINYSRLREVVAPFILRRLKTDKSIIPDLPDKIELKAFASLSKKQFVLYTDLVKWLSRQLETAQGIERKGLVLATITKFKQICNHPDQYLGSGTFDVSQSGKFGVLQEICETIREKRERVLIFTQFKEMTEPLREFLEHIWGRKGLVLHGGTPVKKRTQLVEKFCGEEYVPFMVLSLKAGGVGLNLARANHVIHFDRWWNPAVENQATDRAFRIGQTRDVFVHKLITAGTVEEKIDTMLEDKLKLSKDVLAVSDERWITEMSNEELLNLLKLSS